MVIPMLIAQFSCLWDKVEDVGEYLDPDFYFFTYKRNKNGNFGIYGSTEEYPGKKQKDF